MFEQATAAESRNAIGDWALRGGIAVAFVLFGIDKFPSQPDSMWVKMFQQIGVGQWFRYFTGVVEVMGGLMVLIPRTVTVGLALLACTMASAALILIFVLGRAGDSVFSLMFLAALTVFWLSRRG